MPVPHAMISLPRSLRGEPSKHIIERRPAGAVAGLRFAWRPRCTSGKPCLGQTRSHRTGLCAISDKPSRATGICCASSASSAFLSPLFSRGDDQAARVNGGLPRCGEERIDVVLLQVVARFVELALDRAEPPVSRSRATRSIPVSLLPPLPDHSDHIHTSLNFSTYNGSVVRYACISRSNRLPMSRRDVAFERISASTEWIVAARVLLTLGCTGTLTLPGTFAGLLGHLRLGCRQGLGGYELNDAHVMIGEPAAGSRTPCLLDSLGQRRALFDVRLRRRLGWARSLNASKVAVYHHKRRQRLALPGGCVLSIAAVGSDTC